MKTELPVVGEDGERAERCDRCKWWVKIDDNGLDWGFNNGDAFGQCRRYPPVKDASNAKTGFAGADPDNWNFPATNLGHWCGEWAAIPAPAGG